MPIPFIIAGAAAIAAIAWAVDERNEREREQRRFRAKIESLEERIAEMEAERRRVRKSLRKRHGQIRALAAEICELRRERNRLRGRQAAWALDETDGRALRRFRSGIEACNARIAVLGAKRQCLCKGLRKQGRQVQALTGDIRRLRRISAP